MFKNADVAAKYELAGEDQTVYCPGYSGLLSNAPLSAVEGMFKRGSNLVRVKQPATGKKDDK